jgi:tripartite-type tricarboxylate transporter receptor subunit TctC
MAQPLSDNLGVSIQAENIPEAGSLQGTAEVLRAEPDGYTLLAMNPPSTPINEMVNPQPWDMTKLVGLGKYARSVRVIVSNPDLNFEGIEDIIDSYQSGDISAFGSQPKGSIDHVIARVMKKENGMEYENYVGYEGSGPVAEAVASGEVPVGVGTDAAMLSAVEGGSAEPIVVLHTAGSTVFPDAPTLEEEGISPIDYVGAVTRCFWAPPGASDQIVQKFSNALETTIQNSSELKSWQEETGNTLNYGPPSEANSVLEQSYSQIPNKVDIDSISNA